MYKAEDLELGEEVALKTILPQIAANPKMMERFRREIQFARKVTHPLVCRVFDLFHHKKQIKDQEIDIVFLSMQFLEGETLRQRILREGRLNQSDVSLLLSDIVPALEAAHEAGIVHRDFKSSPRLSSDNMERERSNFIFGNSHLKLH